MNRLLTLLLVGVLIVAGCVPATAEPTFTNDQLATRVNQILTTMPTYTIEPTLAPTAEELPGTGGATAVPVDTAVVLPEDTSTPQLPTETLQATEEPEIAGTPSDTPATGTSDVDATPGITQTPDPTETLPDTDPRLTLGTPTSVDTMDNATTWNWPTGKLEFTSTKFENGKLILTGLTDVTGWQLPILTFTSDKYIEMKAQARECTGSDNYGMIFNVPVLLEADRGYLFAISCDGKYQLREWDGKFGEKGQSIPLILWKTSDAIKTGAKVDNRIGVMTKDGEIRLYVNGILLEKITDSTYKNGFFGVLVNPDFTEELTIEIDEMSLWNLD